MKLKQIRLKPKSDKYRKARSGTSQFIDLYCSQCDHFLATYQKDGAGNLFRLYVDRLFTHDEQLLGPFQSLSEMPTFKCQSCKFTMGIPMNYDKEQRLAYRIIQPIHKRKNKQGIYPPS